MEPKYIKHGIDLTPEINIKQVYVALSAACLFGAMVDLSWRRYLLATFSFAFIFGADKIKDTEKIAKKVRLETENIMNEKMLNGWKASMQDEFDTVRENITKTAEALLKQISMSVRDASPTRTDREPGCRKGCGCGYDEREEVNES